MTKFNKFLRGETTYTCQTCKKLTRNVGEGAEARLCIDCWNLAGIENYISDEGEAGMLVNYGDEVRGILAKRPELAQWFPQVAAALN